MKTREIEEEFYVSSGLLSSCIRTCDLGIIAVVWALSNQNSNELVDNSMLRMVVLFAVSSLAFDVVHYLWRSITMGISVKKAKKKDKRNNKECDDHEYIDGTAFGSYVFWGIKTILCVISASYLIAYYMNTGSQSTIPKNDLSPKEPPLLTPTASLKDFPSSFGKVDLSSCYVWNGYGIGNI